MSAIYNVDQQRILGITAVSLKISLNIYHLYTTEDYGPLQF